ncbi:hypothetical protein AB3Z07_20910 [Metabacillus halosaccharovorans]|uniref:Uncharacterized protein n=1 Tax=Metabacillus halosaccharovorans TaxID=930124 RepID=A0ABT3DIM6_9BACI|nr:hypothetical protein [Metabacillus halosaccharovorans]MCM3440098.1 hypothetical protein [Metabacillus halosaccharovorans]MCV9886909.1 hypothetical protein [Metabacillus halosaccharovorans]
MDYLNPIIGLFLYFPEDKTEYIPAAITMVIFTIAAFFAFRFILKVSKKEEDKVDNLMNEGKQSKEK